MQERVRLEQGDCLELMKTIKDRSIDMILCDLPYGTTDNKWDIKIPLDELWQQYKRIIKTGGVIALFAQTPFDKELGASNLDWLKYEWIWVKNNATGFLNAKKAPLKAHENILIFYETLGKLDTTNLFTDVKEYLMSEKDKAGLTGDKQKELLGNYMGRHYFTRASQFVLPSEEAYKKLQSTGYFEKTYSELKEEYSLELNGLERERLKYTPQGLIKLPKAEKRTRTQMSENYGKWANRKAKETIIEYTNYPKDVLFFDKVEKIVHPTQKPTELLEYLIKTYTKENELILDNCMGSGSTGVACVNTNRKFIGIEKEKKYFGIAEERIEKAMKEV